MARLGVNIRQIAALKEMGGCKEPDPVSAAVLAEIGGADSIVCSVNESLKPVTERDARLLREVVKSHFNLRTPPTDRMLQLAVSIAPDMITLVPGKKAGTTQGGGLDVLGHESPLGSAIHSLRNKKIVVSVLVDPSIHQVKSAAKLGADYVEFHLGPLAEADSHADQADFIEKLSSVSAAASKLGLGVAVGKGVNYQNINEIVRIMTIEEINVGHALISRALWVGMEAAVRDMAALVH